jgi:small subunit ribosomal protein S1
MAKKETKEEVQEVVVVATKKKAPKATKKVAPKKEVKKEVKEEVQEVAVAATKKKAPKATKKAAPKKEVKEEVKEEVIEVATEAVKEDPKKDLSLKERDPEAFLNDFNWHNYQEGIDPIDDGKLEEFEKLVADNFVDTLDDEVVDGIVVFVTDRDAIIDINAKSEGVISLNEFRYNPGLKVGDKVEVLIDVREDSTGQLILSHRKARTIKAWERVNKAHDEGTIVNGFVKCRTKGGMIVDVFGIEAFLPGSQIDVKPIRDYDVYVDKTMEFKVVKINHEFKNVVVSHKALIEADIEEQKKEIIGQLEKGQVLEGIVKNITSYGVFVDLGGVDGLVHITDLSWSRINHPNEIVELDQKLNVVILDFDENKSRIQLGLKQLSKHPWDSLGEEVKVGDKLKGKVVVIADYGAFIEVANGVEGLIHVSEMSWSTHLRSAQDFVTIGEELEAVILTLDRDTRKMSLGIKQITPDPWADITKKYSVGSTHKGIVRNFTNFGVFAEMEEGIDGLIYISDLSWTKKIKHPSEFTDIGDELEVVVLELDVQGRKLSLGHKQTTVNPWDKHQKDFALGTKHTAAIFEIVDKGATINFNDEIVAFVPTRHLEKEDGTKLQKGEEAQFEIIEFNKEFKKVVASHMTIHKEEEAKIVKQAAKKQAKASDEAKPTLGDANKTLQDLKDKMDGKK